MKTYQVQTTEDIKALSLSYYTLSMLSDHTRYANPFYGVPDAIARGEYKGLLTLDNLGNFVSFV